MTIKRVRLNENVHKKLLHLKETTNAKSINDVIASLIQINEEFYTNKGRLNVKNKIVVFKYNDGQLVEIEIRNSD